ncbi:hypothetical protein AB835_06450 [Candidatus Endobugula sertula]|uniref:PBP domain-containing protein n=1 Tax=Candidatus Endobugula sertula TaxID=62101 RepID=A0A1D2QQK7_9GAMM|nr:hypothetical protein AB835_06450 [Candidatus Endobugula sertula]
MPKWLFRFTITGLSVLLFSCSKSESILLGTTTTLQDSGLLAVLVGVFNQQHAVKIKPIVAGSGHIFTLIERGDVDIAITHEPIGEQSLVDRQIVTERTPIMYNYFLIVGPKDDPARVHLSSSANKAFANIYESNSIFVSRYDNSGTHYVEKRLWNAANRQPTGNHYIRTGVGMGATLTIAAERNAYTLVDLGTWLAFQNKQSLRVLFQETRHLSQQQAQQHLLTNQYSLLTMTPNSSNQHHQKQAAVFAQWIRQPKTQQLINNYHLYQQTIFITNQ